MFTDLFKFVRTATLATVVGLGVTAWIVPEARAQHAVHQDHAVHQSGTAHDAHGGHDGAAQHGPHGGQITAKNSLTYEVVYQPQEIRVYVYRATRQPQTVRGVQGEIVTQPRDAHEAARVPLRYVAPAAGAHGQDYLAAAIDLSQVKDGELAITFNLEKLPQSRQPEATFTQTFALSKTKPQVTTAAINEHDRAGIASQRICPVTGGGLGSMGGPIKVLVGDQPVYLCCRGCVNKVVNDPETYLAKAKKSSQGH